MERKTPRTFIDSLKVKLHNLLKYGSSDFFKFVSIETIAACNRRCHYCPNSKYERGLIENKKLLSSELFYKIIDELAGLEVCAYLSPSLNGEPLLDERLTQFVQYAKIRLALVRILIFTNGDFLTVALYESLIAAGAGEFIITKHSQEISANMKNLLAYRERIHDERVGFSYKELDFIRNRGGLVNEGSPIEATSCRAFSPELAIDADGNVILCCDDYLSSVRFGNVRDKSIMDIWKSRNFVKARSHIRRGLFEFEICRKCRGAIN
ncbi:MAG: radical SAM/SPASM domain-containing protein [Planctomycetota bacterium]